MNLRRSICCVMLLCLWALSSPVVLAEKNPTITEAQREFFEKKIRPVLAEQCFDCHNSIDKKKGGLALDWSQPLRQGGDSGRVVIPGDPDGSLLIQSIRHQAGVESMPGKAPKLVDSVIADFIKWGRHGAALIALPTPPKIYARSGIRRSRNLRPSYPNTKSS